MKRTVFQSLLWAMLLATLAHASSSSTYESVRALDRSGQALQLKHAQAAADEQGRLILAFALNETAVYIVSPSTVDSSSRHYQRPLPSRRTLLSQRISADDSSCSTWLICTGVQADARWLIRQLQTYAKVVQFRYGMQPQSVATAVSALKRALFWGYDEQDNDNKTPSWQSSIQDVWQDQRRWGRPVGVRTLVIAPRADDGTNHNNKYSLQMVEPSGVITPCPKFACMGVKSELIRAKLEQLLLESDLLDEKDLQHVVQQALIATMVSPPEKLHVEVITAGGIERKTWSLDV